MSVECGVGQFHRIADVHRFQIPIVDMSPHPDRRNIADGETRRGAGLDHQTRRHQLLHHDSRDGRPHRQLRIDGDALILRLIDFLLRYAENLEACKSFSTSAVASL